MAKRLLFMWLLLVAGVAGAKNFELPGPVLGGGWLLAHADADLVVLDIQEPQLFARHHIAGAVNWPFSQWRTNAKAKPPRSLPPLDSLAARLGRLGITRQTPLVIVATGSGPSDLSAAARVWWTLKVLGHEQAAILDGGLVSYVNEFKGRYVSGKAQPRKPVEYRAVPDLDLLATREWIRQQPTLRLLDARSLEEHIGLLSGQGERPGTMPGARHLPFDWLAEDAKIRPERQLRKLFDYAQLEEGGAVHFCHTGNRAALTWFVDYAILGNRKARLYDGSMLDWAKQPDTPMVQELSLGQP